MKKLSMSLLFAFLLVGCGGEVEVHAYNPAPSLVRFDMVDSFGVDTARSSAALRLDPYVDNGLFDIFWKVNSLEDYRINFRINDVASTNNSFLIYSEVCGAGRACDQAGGVICEYTADFYLSCNNSRHPVDISALFKRVPQTLYAQMEVCDLQSSYCTYTYYPVLMQ